jgi:hypothetical protein
VVGGGAGAALDGAGAGAELGGASLAAGDEPPPPPPLEPPDEPGEPDEPEAPDEPEELEERAVAGPGWTVGCAAPAALARARARCRWPADEAADPAGAPGAASLALGACAACAVVWAGAVRANKAAMPTAVTALIWVARQVSRDRRRSPSARTSPGNSIGVEVAVMTVGESRYGSPVPWVS